MAETQDEMFRPASQETPVVTKRETGTRAILKKVAPDSIEKIRTTSQKLEKEVDATVPQLIDAFTNLRDALAEARPTRGTSTRAELVKGAAPKMTLVVIGDCSPSMQTGIHAWANGQLKGVEAEDKLIALLGSAAVQMSTGQYGDFDTEFVLFSLPDRANGDDLRQENGTIPGKTKSGGRDNLSKVIKPRGQVFREEDLVGVYTFLRDPNYRGYSTIVSPSLEILKEELQQDTEWANRIKNHEEALCVLVITDGEVHDTADANRLVNGANGLAEKGAYVMTAVIGNNTYTMNRVTGAHTFSANSPEQFIEDIKQQAAVAQSERGGRRFSSR